MEKNLPIASITVFQLTLQSGLGAQELGSFQEHFPETQIISTLPREEEGKGLQIPLSLLIFKEMAAP